MSVAKLKSYIKKNGKAKTAVALGLIETNAINNWIARKSIPVAFQESVKNLKHKKVIVVADDAKVVK
jgi:hypothetical protein